MACPTCGERISWVPIPGGRRVAVGAVQDPNGSWYLDKDGILRAYHIKVPGNVPRYARHVPCPEEA